MYHEQGRYAAVGFEVTSYNLDSENINHEVKLAPSHFEHNIDFLRSLTKLMPVKGGKINFHINEFAEVNTSLRELTAKFHNTEITTTSDGFIYEGIKFNLETKYHAIFDDDSRGQDFSIAINIGALENPKSIGLLLGRLVELEIIEDNHIPF